MLRNELSEKRKEIEDLQEKMVLLEARLDSMHTDYTAARRELDEKKTPLEDNSGDNKVTCFNIWLLLLIVLSQFKESETEQARTLAKLQDIGIRFELQLEQEAEDMKVFFNITTTSLSV